MADFFHRLVAPTYYTGGGTFPVEAGTTYDYINNGGGGTPAFADGVKSGGPNSGTYFSAFGEDATSNNINRANKALAENCDHMDNLLHRSIAVSVRTADVNPGAPVASIVLPVGTFLGSAAYTNTPADLNRLFEILNDNDDEIIIQGTGVKVFVDSVVLGSGDLIGGGGANGSFSGNTVTLTLNVSIPAGQVYRVYYGTRTNLATMPIDSFTNILIRGAEEASATVENLFRLLHGNNLSWNAAWTSTIFDLARSGIFERYARATTSVVSPPETYFPQTLDTAGAGAWFVRSGMAITGYAFDAGAYLDPINAIFSTKFFDLVQANSGGATGFVAYGSRLSGTAITGEKTYQPGTATFMSLWSHRHTTSLHASDPNTRIPKDTACTLTTPDTNVNTGEAVVELTNAADYFRKTGPGNSSISLGYDMIELQFTQSAVVKRRTYVIVAHGSSADTNNIRKIRVRNLDGTIPDFTGSSASTVVAWHSLNFAVGDGVGRYHQQTHAYSTDVKVDGLFYQVPPYLLSAAGDNVVRVPPSFSARLAQDSESALRWGGFSHSAHGPVWAGDLRGDGSLDALQGRFTGTQTPLMLAELLLRRHRQTAGTEKSLIIDMAIGSTEAGDADNFGIRFYRHKLNGSGLDALEIVSNAMYDNVADLWTPENATPDKMKVRLTDDELSLSRVAAGAATFADAAWVERFLFDLGSLALFMRDTRLSFSNTTVGATNANPASTQAVSNELRAKNIPKCWGDVNTDAGGSAPAVNDGFNISALAVINHGGGTNNGLRVTMASAMQSTNYCIIANYAGASGSAAIVAFVDILSTTQFVIRLRNVSSSGGADQNDIDLAANDNRINFVVFGRQDT